MKRILLISVALLLCLGACASGYSSGGRSGGGSVDKQRPGAFYQDDWKPGQ